MDYQKHLEICRKATKGPWEATYLSEDEIYITKGYRLVNGAHAAEWIAKIDSGDDVKNEEVKLADAEFISFARNHMKQYITCCQELDAELQLTIAEKKKLESAAIDKHLRIQGLEAENKRLREALANIASYNYDRRDYDPDDVECLRVMAIKALDKIVNGQKLFNDPSYLKEIAKKPLGITP